MKKYLVFTLFLLVSASMLFSQQANEKTPSSIQEKTLGMAAYPGFLPFYWDAKEGKIWLRIDSFEKEFLFVNSLAHGIGSNDIGLDRGQIGDERIVKFVRSGPKILLLQPNYGFRATDGDAAAQTAVREAFAESVLWGFRVGAEIGDTVLVDATDFFLHDWHHVVETLRSEKQGNYSLDMNRSAVFLPGTKNFPQNSEFEVTLTYSGDNPGNQVYEVVPSPQLITVHEHYSLVQLPDNNFSPRAFDPRAGYFSINYMDFSAPLGEPLTKLFITRHRLQKKDPSAEVSEPVKPLIYYVDNGAPKDVRDALIEGASWWGKAFEAAGFKNAFQVKVLPDSADPMDIRYNVIQWVDRATRGWSYGASIIDPRTGEIIKGQVTLGALRVRQDYLIAEGLLSPYVHGNELSEEIHNVVLARIRQLAAHETGHTLGLAHNFAASTDGRASVMDYPYPEVIIDKNGKLDLSSAYAVGVGAWDIRAIRYGYKQFNTGADQEKELNKTMQETIAGGLHFLSDEAARPDGSASPIAHLWDNGKNALDELMHVMKVREIALNNLGEGSIRTGMPLAHLEDVLVPIYMFHRYQVTAASKLIGGVDYTYAVKGDGQIPNRPVPPDEQKKAISALLATIAPDALAVPESVLKLIPPQPNGYGRTREDFKGKTGLIFDPLSPAENAADLTVALLLNPERDARLIENHVENKLYPGLEDLIDGLINDTWKKNVNVNGYKGAIGRTVNYIVLNNLISLAKNAGASEQVKAVVNLKIDELEKWIDSYVKYLKKDEDQKAQFRYALQQIKLFRENPDKYAVPPTGSVPPGQPIGEF